MGAPVTLYLEINALGGTGLSEWARGYNEALDEVLTILERRGFSEATDASHTKALMRVEREENLAEQMELRRGKLQSLRRALHGLEDRFGTLALSPALCILEQIDPQIGGAS